MPDWPLRGDGQLIEAVGVNAAASVGTAIPSSIAEGTSSAIGSGTPGTLTDDTKDWVTDEWVGYRVMADNKLLEVASNTGTVLTGDAAWSPSAPTSPVAYALKKAHVKGSWVQLKDATTFAAQGIIVNFSQQYQSRGVMDIGIGAAGSEKVLIPDLIYDGCTPVGTVFYCHIIHFPILVPKAARLSARVQDPNPGSSNHFAHAQLVGQGFLPSQPFSRVAAYGVDTANTRGTAVNPGGTSHTKGAWSQLVASSTNPARTLYLAVGMGGATIAKASWLVDIGIGAEDSELVLVPDLGIGSETLYDMIFPQWVGPIPCSIPAGTRLSVRAQCSALSTNIFYAAIYGLD